MRKLSLGRCVLLLVIALSATAGGRWVGFTVFSDVPHVRYLGSDAAVDFAIKGMSQYAKLCDLVEEIGNPEGWQAAEERGPESAVPPIVIDSVAKYLHERRARASADDILKSPSLNESSEPISQDVRDQVTGLLDVFRWRCRRLLDYRAEVVRGQGATLELDGRLREARFRKSPDVEAFVRGYAERHPGHAILHLRPELYEGGDDIADWLVLNKRLYLITYADIPELEIIDNYIIHLEKGCAGEIVETLCAAAIIRDVTRDRMLSGDASLRYTPN